MVVYNYRNTLVLLNDNILIEESHEENRTQQLGNYE